MDNNKENESKPHSCFHYIADKLKSIPALFRSDVDTVVSTTGNEADDCTLHESRYGFTKNGRTIGIYIITAIICALIIGGSYCLALLIPGDKAALNSKAARLRKSESYVKIKSEYDTLTYDNNKLQTSINEKQDKLDGIDNIDNTKAELRSQIEEKQNELNGLETKIKQKESEAASISKEINDKFGSIKTLTPGTYMVGKSIPPGNYLVTGNGKFNVASKDKVSKVNTVLSSETLAVTLEDGDSIKLETTAKFILNWQG